LRLFLCPPATEFRSGKWLQTHPLGHHSKQDLIWLMRKINGLLHHDKTPKRLPGINALKKT
jgi:hypothetical protein